jgi:hypothetical protein
LAFGFIAIYPPNKVLLLVVNLLSPKPLAPVNIVLDLPLVFPMSVLVGNISAFVGGTTTGAAGAGVGAGGGGFGLDTTPPILSS